MAIEINPAAAAPRTEFFDDKDALTAAVARKMLAVLRETSEADGVVHVGLTGGGAGIGALSALGALLREGASAPDWGRVHFWWGDERLLPARDPERNDHQAREALLDFLVAEHGLPEENIHPMPTSEEAAHPAAGAEMYAQQLEVHASSEDAAPAGGASALKMPGFALMLLGVGPDGHINSLFPGKAALHAEGAATVGEEDSPKPPALRVSLTFDAVHTAARVWTVVAGEDKAEAVAKAFAETTPVEEIPARNARGTLETVWHIDAAAASRLS
ncbi:6-phosphogluconolactonase [Nesterenkonia flava]|uniref:6-phosphogluconolactonase n=1 Tax=Nesterenkonia flava TaxID=469799 RepID=A0ABU1FQ20_9MICC|nr:6-phosphogluconolactonase [Nesterenkonia flava]MDR5710704.1 6-phosphogluconolactonase [Nesterenkonia flava]